MSKVLLIGIDGLDSLLLEKFRGDLPNFRRLREESPQVKLTSIFPPDSLPAWASIHTGLNPARHGVINFIDPGDKSGKIVFQDIDNRVFRGKTLWDLASARDKKVCILLPYAIYPAWPINGVMACRTMRVVPEDFPIDIYPREVAQNYRESRMSLNLFHGFPSRKGLPKFLRSLRQRTLNEAELGLKMLKEQDWDLFFLFFSALDAVQHTFWSYCDPKDPDYPGASPYRNVIRDFYALCDEVIGKFLAQADSDTAVILLSDHGHGMRPAKLLNVNEILRREGLLLAKAGRSSLRGRILRPEALKRSLSKLVARYGIGSLGLKMLQAFPLWKRVLISPSLLDWERSRAYVSDISGIKAYSQGGIMVKRGADYEETRSSVIRALVAVRDPESGEKIMKWIGRREELYSGEHLAKYPDLLFELEEDWGVGWAIHQSLTDSSPLHHLQPGGHKRYSPVFLLSNLGGREATRDNLTLMDIAPTVLDLLGLGDGFDLEGRSLFR